MKIDGSCHCGAIRYEAEIDPDQVSICHCTDCQVLTGSAFRITVPVQSADFHLTAGTPKAYLKTTADSGARRIQTFCADCGSPIYACADEPAPRVIGLRVGTIRQRQELKPTRQIWRHSALAWVPEMDELATAAKQS